MLCDINYNDTWKTHGLVKLQKVQPKSLLLYCGTTSADSINAEKIS